MIVVLVVTTILTQLIKIIVMRPRPYTELSNLILLDLGTDYSFPSGHTSAAFALFTCLALMTPRRLAPLWMTAAWAVAYSRIYLSQHFLEDILSGSLIGMISSCAVYMIIDHFINKKKSSVQ